MFNFKLLLNCRFDPNLGIVAKNWQIIFLSLFALFWQLSMSVKAQTNCIYNWGLFGHLLWMFFLFLFFFFGGGVKSFIHYIQRHTVQDHVMECYARPRRDELVETKMIILSDFCLNTNTSGFVATHHSFGKEDTLIILLSAWDRSRDSTAKRNLSKGM